MIVCSSFLADPLNRMMLAISILIAIITALLIFRGWQKRKYRSSFRHMLTHHLSNDRIF